MDIKIKYLSHSFKVEVYRNDANGTVRLKVYDNDGGVGSW
jgi:hypothetical protein